MAFDTNKSWVTVLSAAKSKSREHSHTHTHTHKKTAVVVNSHSRSHKRSRGHVPGPHVDALFRYFQSEQFDIYGLLHYLYRSGSSTHKVGVQTYLVNRLYTMPSQDVDFILPQLW